MTINEQFSAILGFEVIDISQSLEKLDREGKFNQKVILDLLGAIFSRLQDQEKEIKILQNNLGIGKITQSSNKVI